MSKASQQATAIFVATSRPKSHSFIETKVFRGLCEWRRIGWGLRVSCKIQSSAEGDQEPPCSQQIAESEVLVPARAGRSACELYQARRDILIALDWHLTIQSRDGSISHQVKGFISELNALRYCLVA